MCGILPEVPAWLLMPSPLVCNYAQGNIALAHNGNLTNAKELKEKLANQGSVFQSTIDTELIINLIASYGQNPIEESFNEMHD